MYYGRLNHFYLLTLLIIFFGLVLVKAMKNAQRTENPFKFTAAKNSSDSTKPQNKNKKSNEEPVLKSKPEPDPGPSIDDCPELVTDSESDDDSDEDDDDDDDSDDDGLDLKNVLNLVSEKNFRKFM